MSAAVRIPVVTSAPACVGGSSGLLVAVLSTGPAALVGACAGCFGAGGVQPPDVSPGTLTPRARARW